MNLFKLYTLGLNFSGVAAKCFARYLFMRCITRSLA
jgi:hypothetical protein